MLRAFGNGRSRTMAEEEFDLSPAVRRLLKLYELDARTIAGSGPNGRLRVSDVMAVLGSSTSNPTTGPSADAMRPLGAAEDNKPARDGYQEPPITSVFECDTSAVLRDRKRRLAEHGEILLTSYFVLAASRALRAVPEVHGYADRIDLAVPLPGAAGSTLATVRDADLSSLAEVDRILRGAHCRPALDIGGHRSFKLYHHGASGSLLATPTPLPPAETASLGIGQIRRQVVVPQDRPDASPRVAPMCLVSLSFRTSRLDMHRANAFLAVLVEQIESWTESPGMEADYSTAAIASTT
jgi:pyruvate/2-oxoglutarate dehydrogenase complex dihydrolipoamide acyltransferase (E2) component